MTSGVPRQPNEQSAAAKAAEMLDRIVRSQPSRAAHRLPEALANLRADRPEDVKLVLEKIIALLDRVTRQVETIQKAPVLQYNVDDLAQAFERGGRQALKEAICNIEESQRQIEANLAEIHKLLPRPREPRVQRRLMWIAALVGVVLGAGIGMLAQLI